MVLAVLAPPTPPEHLREAGKADSGFEDGSMADPARFQLPANASPFQKRAAAFLRHRLGLPDVVLVILFGIRAWMWAALAAWLIAGPIAAKFKARAPPPHSSTLFCHFSARIHESSPLAPCDCLPHKVSCRFVA
jgi:hypothetical protein